MNYTDTVRYIAREYLAEFEYLAYSDSLYKWRDVYDTLHMLMEQDSELEYIINNIPVPYLDFKTLAVDITECLNSMLIQEYQQELKNYQYQYLHLQQEHA